MLQQSGATAPATDPSNAALPTAQAFNLAFSEGGNFYVVVTASVLGIVLAAAILAAVINDIRRARDVADDTASAGDPK